MSASIEAIIRSACARVEPGPEEQSKVLAVAEKLLSLVKEQAGSAGAEVQLGGSVGRGTWLKGEADVDIFVKFPPNLSREQLERNGLEVATRALDQYPINLRYAEHPYVESIIDGVTVNVVPCYNVRPGDWKTIADRSPYHIELIKARLTDKIRTEIRLFKGFLKGLGLYGAEIEVEGFSGLVSEILVLHYGTFLNTIRSVSDWKWSQAIGLQGPIERGPVKTDKIRIVDPVDNRRDLGAAISKKQVARLIMAARTFIKNPSLLYFEPKQINPLTILRNSPLIPNMLVVILKHETRSEDILWGQLKRTLRHLANQLREQDFQIYEAGASSDRDQVSALFFLLENPVISNWRLNKGPEAIMKEASNRFSSENRGRALAIWVDELGRLNALHQRRFRSAQAALKDFLTTGSGVAPGLKAIIKSNEIFVGPEIFNAVHRYPWVAQGLARLCSGEQEI